MNAQGQEVVSAAETAAAMDSQSTGNESGIGRRFRSLLSRLAGKDGYETIYYSSRLVIFLVDLLIGMTIGYLIYVLEWSYVREQLILFVIWFLGIFDYLIRTTAFQGPSLRIAITLDLLFVALSAAISGCFRDYRYRVWGNVALAVTALAVGRHLMFSYGIISNAFPIICCILLIMFVNQYAVLKAERQKSRIASERNSAEFAVVRHIAHNVRPQILIAKAPLLSVRNLLKEQGVLDEALPTPLLNGSRETVGEALEKALTTLRQINDIVGNARNLIGREICAEDFEEVDLQEMFEQDVLPLYSDSDMTIEIDCRVARRVRLHRASFVEALNNIIRNAATHAFPAGFDSAAPKVLRFEIRENVKDLFFDYTNNGQPFPDNLDAREFLTFGRKSSDSPGEGLGGAWIGKVVEAHGGTFEILRDGHPVHFRITIPKREPYGKSR